jgi:hypothetical protein
LTSRITLDRYVYEDIYPAFKASTDEKEITARLSSRFLNSLARRNLVLAGSDPVPVADIGCGPCDTLIKYLTGVVFPPGFIVRATDYLPEYADAEKGEALEKLASAQRQGTIKLISFSARAGDAFAGNLSDLLSGQQDGPNLQRAFRIVYASHVLYHADGPSAVRRMLGDIATNILSADGVCILYHLANKPGTFQYYRARFGSEFGAATDSDTGAVTIDDPTEQIRAACAANHLPLSELEFDTMLRFGSLGDDEWRSFKTPESYDALASSNAEAYEDLKRLYFVVQRSPIEFAADRSAKGLDAFTNEIRKVIESNRGMLPSSERMQVFTRADAAPILWEAIAEGLKTVLLE